MTKKIDARSLDFLLRLYPIKKENVSYCLYIKSGNFEGRIENVLNDGWRGFLCETCQTKLQVTEPSGVVFGPLVKYFHVKCFPDDFTITNKTLKLKELRGFKVTTDLHDSSLYSQPLNRGMGKLKAMEKTDGE